MEVANVATFLNNAAKQMSGEIAILEEDLSNLVDFGRSIDSILGTDAGLDLIFNKLPDQFNTIKTWSRPYLTIAPSVYMENDRFGAIRAMYKTDYLPAVEAPMWNLTAGTDYSMDVFQPQSVKTTFWNKRYSSMVKHNSIVHEQLESAFRSPVELMAFIGMLEMARTNSHSRDWDNECMSLIRSMIAVCYNSGNRVSGASQQDIKLLTEFKTLYSSYSSMTAAEAMTNEAFIRYAVYRMGQVRSQMRLVTGLFSSTGFLTQCPEDRQKVVYIDDFSRACGVYLHDGLNQFNTGSLQLPKADSVPAWQGMGTSASQADRMKVDVDTTFEGNSVRAQVPYVMALVFDEWACGITAYRHNVTMKYNDLGHFTNMFDQMLGGAFIDVDAPAVIFRCA